MMSSRLRFRSLGSGSTGNATVVEGHCPEHGSTRLLVDCGFTLKQLELRCAQAELAPETLNAIFITHEHADHIGCAVQLADKYGIHLLMSRGTYHAIGEPSVNADLTLLRDGDSLTLGSLTLEPFTVPHDAQEPLQLRVRAGAAQLGILTDLGYASAHVLENLLPCASLLLECNHDPEMLQASQYPPFLKNRIAGRLGHLRNDEALRIISHLRTHGALQLVVAAHLSERNNCPERVRSLLAQHMQCAPDMLHIACPQAGTPWVECPAPAVALPRAA